MLTSYIRQKYITIKILQIKQKCPLSLSLIPSLSLHFLSLALSLCFILQACQHLCIIIITCRTFARKFWGRGQELFLFISTPLVQCFWYIVLLCCETANILQNVYIVFRNYIKWSGWTTHLNDLFWEYNGDGILCIFVLLWNGLIYCRLVIQHAWGVS